MSLRRAAELHVAEQEGERRTAERAELALVHVLEEQRLIEVRGPREVPLQLPAVAVEDTNLHGGGQLVLADQLLQAAPTRLELLELLDVQNLVHLLRDQTVKGRNPGGEGALGGPVHLDSGLGGLLDEAV